MTIPHCPLPDPQLTREPYRPRGDSSELSASSSPTPAELNDCLFFSPDSRPGGGGFFTAHRQRNALGSADGDFAHNGQIGRASCRERV